MACSPDPVLRALQCCTQPAISRELHPATPMPAFRVHAFFSLFPNMQFLALSLFSGCERNFEEQDVSQIRDSRELASHLKRSDDGRGTHSSRTKSADFVFGPSAGVTANMPEFTHTRYRVPVADAATLPNPECSDHPACSRLRLRLPIVPQPMRNRIYELKVTGQRHCSILHYREPSLFAIPGCLLVPLGFTSLRISIRWCLDQVY